MEALNSFLNIIKISSKLFVTLSLRMRTDIHPTFCCNQFRAGLSVPVMSDNSIVRLKQNFCRPLLGVQYVLKNVSHVRSWETRKLVTGILHVQIHCLLEQTLL